MVIPPDKMAGIPTVDSTNNELVDWMRSVTNVYAAEGASKVKWKIRSVG